VILDEDYALLDIPEIKQKTNNSYLLGNILGKKQRSISRKTLKKLLKGNSK